MIIVVTAKIYSPKAKGYIKETQEEQFFVNEKQHATVFDIFHANRYVKMIPEMEYLLADIKIKKYEVKHGRGKRKNNAKAR